MTLLPILLVLAQQRPLTGLDAYITQGMKDWRVPGLAIVVVQGDSVLFMKGYGVRELGKPDPVTVHTRFGNMSTTKAFTALLVAMLADSGKLALDDPVQKHEPAVQFADPYVTREITVRDLLTHRVGFGDPDYLWGTSGLDSLEGDRHGEMAALPARQRSRGGATARQPAQLRRAISAAADRAAAVLSHGHADQSPLPGVRPRLDPAGLSRRIHRDPHRQ